MGYHSFPYFAIPLTFSEDEAIWLQNAVEKLNISLGHLSKNELKLMYETYSQNGIFTTDYGRKYVRDENNFRLYLDEIDDIPCTISLGEKGLSYVRSNLSLELTEEVITKTCHMLQIFLKEFNRPDILRFIAHITNNRDYTDKDDYLFIGGKISKDNIEILNLVDKIFENEPIIVLPDYNYVYDY